MAGLKLPRYLRLTGLADPFLLVLRVLMVLGPSSYADGVMVTNNKKGAIYLLFWSLNTPA